MPAFLAYQMDAAVVAAGDSLSQGVAASEWLGPLAPIAISPFFGLAALSGVATFGPEWLQQRSGLVDGNGPLNSPLLFCTMACLALVTSLPRLTKVSKPIALTAENIEAYSAIIIFVALRWVPASQTAVDDGYASSNLMLQAGVLASLSGLSWQILASLFSAINIFVINAVKLFFEFLVWLIPFPSVDAALEAANKTLCLGLISLYLYSPTLAMLLNLLMLAVCAMIFGWCYRRLEFYRELIAGPMLAWLCPAWFAWRGRQMKLFCEQELLGVPAYTPLHLTKRTDGNYLLRGRWLWTQFRLVVTESQLESRDGVLGDKLYLETSTLHCTLVHRHSVNADKIPLSIVRPHVSQVIANDSS